MIELETRAWLLEVGGSDGIVRRSAHVEGPDVAGVVASIRMALPEHVAQDWQSVVALCRKSEADAVIAGLEARIAELEAQVHPQCTCPRCGGLDLAEFFPDNETEIEAERDDRETDGE